METIKNYLENMFQVLPKTDEILRLKNELLLNMEEKYTELKSQGKTENEAIGIVISEFGNIDELLNEMDINIINKDETSNENLKVITSEEAEKYILVKKNSSFLVGIGVSLCILGAAVLILLSQLAHDRIIFQTFSRNTQDNLPIIILLLFIAPAVALFIYSGTLTEKYKFIENGEFYLNQLTKSILTNEHEAISTSHKLAIIIGVCLCIISPAAIAIGDMFGRSGSTYGICFLLLIIATAVFLFIRFGSTDSAYKKLLMISEYNTQNRKNNKVIGAVSSIVFPLATCIFLLCGFLFNAWHICWLIFPITGILFGAFAGAYNSIKGVEK